MTSRNQTPLGPVPDPRAPRAFKIDDPNLSADDEDVFASDLPPGEPPSKSPTGSGRTLTAGDVQRGIRWGALFFSAMGALASLAFGLWFARFVSVALERKDWVGWTAFGLLGLMALSALVLLLRELWGFRALARLAKLRKTVKQADLSHSQSLSALRQVEVRLARFIGDAMPSGEGMSSLLLQVPPLAEMVAEADRAAEIAGLGAQANALDSYARSVVAAQKPQLNWNFSGSKAVGAGSSTALTAGISVNVPILTPGSDASVLSARKRAEAARLQREEALESRKYRMAEVHEQAESAFDRAKRTAEVVRDSDRLRNFTLQQWQQLGRRSLFDVMSTEGEHYQLRVAYVNALHDGEQATALLRSLGLGIAVWLE